MTSATQDLLQSEAYLLSLFNFPETFNKENLRLHLRSANERLSVTLYFNLLMHTKVAGKIMSS